MTSSSSDDPEALFQRAAEHALAFRRGIGERLQHPDQTYGEMVLSWDASTPEAGHRPLRLLGGCRDRVM